MSKVLAIVGMGAGVSAAVARRFGREGFAIAALARRAEALKGQVDALSANRLTARAYPADAADPQSLAAALGRASSDLGPIDVLVYNAVAARYKPLSDVGAEDLNADLRVSVGGALAAAQHVLPEMRRRQSGSILFTGGGFAFEPNPQLATLGVGKAAIRNLAFSLFADLKDTGVHAGTVTICGAVKAGTAFDPDRIAEAFWSLHAQTPGSFERELMFKG